MSVLTHSAGYVLRQALVDLSLGTDPDDNQEWPAYHGEEPSEPDDVITVSDTAPRDLGRTAPDSERVELYGVQVRVRAATEAEGWDKVKEVAGALDQVYGTPVTVDPGEDTEEVYVLRHFIRASGPIPLGKENPSSSRRVFTLNGLLSMSEVQ